MKIRTTVIIPNYNGLTFLIPCLNSLKQQTARDFEVLVVDNGSTDGSVEWLKENGIRTVFLPENAGFDGAVNAGIQAVDTPYVILLNNDTVADTYYVEALERTIGRSKRIFSVSSRMVQMHRPELIDDAGDMYSILGWAYQRGVGRQSRLYLKYRRVFSACAGAAIYRRKVFDRIGYFDEKHFAYLEDIDVGYRARLAGFDNVYCPDAVVYHVGSGTSGSKYNSFKVRLTARNSVYLNYKNMRLWQLVVNGPFLLLSVLVKYVFFVKKGFGGDYLSGLFEGFRTAGECRRAPGGRGRLIRELSLQGELYFGTILYFYEFFCRQITHIRSVFFENLRES